MRIEKLRIRNFRGIRDLEKQPAGKNVGLVGPNGSGKSSVIEAIDFLLTGKIQSMSGAGTSGISIKNHAPHINSNGDDSWVEVTFSDGTQSITLKRTVEENTLEYDGDLPGSVSSLISAAQRGQHLLSRSEILEFIISQNQSRSEQLRTLLNLSGIKQRRLELQGAARTLNSKEMEKKKEHRNCQRRLFDLFESDVQSLEEVLVCVNDLREELDGEPLDELHLHNSFRSGLKSPSRRARVSPLQSNQTKNLLNEINHWFESQVENFLNLDSKIRYKTRKVRSDEDALQSLDVLELIQNGRQLLQKNADRCPLCLTNWESDQLETLLKQRERKASKAKERMDELESLRRDGLQLITEIRTAVSSLKATTSRSDDIDSSELGSFLENLRKYEKDLKGNLVDELPYEKLSRDDRYQILAPAKTVEYFGKLMNRASDLPSLDSIEESWDILNTAYSIYSELRQLDEDVELHQDAAEQMDIVHEAYLEARDSVLNDTYEAITTRFEEYYKMLHDDEQHFSPEMNPTKTGLEMQVGFHDQGKHPPHALHSEGHQDSMGLCLYLALCDHLEEGELPLIMLDDVVMSVDAEHRRPLARLLDEKISSEFQIVITTHDELWYRHLRTVGVLSNRGTIKFSSWSIEDGPQIIGQSGDEWDRIDELMKQGDVQAAAHRLRHTSEWFLRETCNQLGARVKFKSDARWTMGDFMGPAKSRFKNLLKKAKQAGQDWGADISDINELDNRRKDVYSQLQSEQGALNPNVHFNENEWASFTTNELQPVVDAFQSLYELFWCDTCNACLRTVEDNHRAVTLKCSCGGKANWNLERK